jgi:lipopolysaccharide biosynthesis regulator YciM
MSEKWFLNKETGVVELTADYVVNEITKRDPVKFEELTENDPRTKEAKEKLAEIAKKVEKDTKVASATSTAEREEAKKAK